MKKYSRSLSSELPKFTIDEKENIYYGSTTFMNNIYKLLEAQRVVL
jgi:hypothetical protein